MKDLTDYYSTVGYLQATGLDEAHAHAKAEEVMEAPIYYTHKGEHPMSNMSYCRFENTNSDLIDCEDALAAMMESHATDDHLSDRELKAAKQLAATCLRIIETLAEIANKPIEDLTEQGVEDAVDGINALCIEEEEA